MNPTTYWFILCWSVAVHNVQEYVNYLFTQSDKWDTLPKNTKEARITSGYTVNHEGHFMS